MAQGRNAAAAAQMVEAITQAIVAEPSVPVTPKDRPEVTAAVEGAISQTEVGNALNMEGLGQSRVILGNVTAVVGTILPILVAIGWLTETESTQVLSGISGLVVLGGIAYSTYGRVAKGLKPLFSKAAT